MRHLLKFCLVMLLVSCGQFEDSASFMNSGLEESAKAKQPIDSSPTPPSPDSANSSLPGSSTSGGQEITVPVNSACLYECTTDARANLAFSAALSYDLNGCKVSSVQGLDMVMGIRLFLKANCDQTEQLYSLDLDLDGVPRGPMALVSQICKDTRANVRSFDASMGESRVLTTFSCDYPLNYEVEARVFVRSQSASGQQFDTIAIDSYRPSNAFRLNEFRLSLEYNDQARAFGLGYANRFQRLSENGLKLGGTIATGYENGFMFSTNGSWIVLRNQSGGQCSRISSSGILECNQKQISSLDRQLIEGGRALSQSSYDGKTTMKSIAINPDNCTETLVISLGVIQGASGNISSFGSGTWSNGLSYVLLYNDGINSLNLALVDEPRAKILANIAVANYSGMTSAWTLQKSNRVLIFFSSGGDLYATTGDFL